MSDDAQGHIQFGTHYNIFQNFCQIYFFDFEQKILCTSILKFIGVNFYQKNKKSLDKSREKCYNGL